MERHELIALMADLSLAGMRAAYDEVMSDGIKRQRTVQQILGDLLAAERAEMQARSIRYQLGAARLPLARTLADYVGDMIAVAEARFEARLRALEARAAALGVRVP